LFRVETTRLHWSFDDPAAVEGDEPARLAAFRRVRDLIKQRLIDFTADN
jgi:arsenate reductase